MQVGSNKAIVTAVDTAAGTFDVAFYDAAGITTHGALKYGLYLFTVLSSRKEQMECKVL
jgi:hypothetical protein